jgi:hypothetical protein
MVVANIKSKIKCGCYGCTERSLGCHDSCSKYKDYVKRNKEINAHMKKEDQYKYLDETTHWSYTRQWKRKK